jgi:hypothetical protein
MITLDSKELAALSAGFSRYEAAIPRSVAAGALRESAKPMLNAARSAAPVGKPGKKALRADYRRGGATRKDLRIRAVKGEGKEIGRVLVGVSQKKGKVGWRTHFITRGYTDRGGTKRPGRDFLKTAYDAKFAEVSADFQRKLYDRFQQWAKTNLPQ